MKKVEDAQQKMKMEINQMLRPSQYPTSYPSFPYSSEALYGGSFFPPFPAPYFGPASFTSMPVSSSFSTPATVAAVSSAAPVVAVSSAASVSTPKRPQKQLTSKSPLPLTKTQLNNEHTLPSSIIEKSKLTSVEDVITKNPKLMVECKAGTLACKIAKDALFGTDVMKACTPIGSRDKPGLPVKELAELKKIMFMQCPQYWKNPIEFEPTWKRCLESVQQCCKRLRLGNCKEKEEKDKN